MVLIPVLMHSFLDGLMGSLQLAYQLYKSRNSKCRLQQLFFLGILVPVTMLLLQLEMTPLLQFLVILYINFILSFFFFKITLCPLLYDYIIVPFCQYSLNDQYHMQFLSSNGISPLFLYFRQFTSEQGTYQFFVSCSLKHHTLKHEKIYEQYKNLQV